MYIYNGLHSELSNRLAWRLTTTPARRALPGLLWCGNPLAVGCTARHPTAPEQTTNDNSRACTRRGRKEKQRRHTQAWPQRGEGGAAKDRSEQTGSDLTTSACYHPRGSTTNRGEDMWFWGLTFLSLRTVLEQYWTVTQSLESSRFAESSEVDQLGGGAHRSEEAKSKSIWARSLEQTPILIQRGEGC